jgi:hypothetical protein
MHEWGARLVFTHFACMYGVVVEIVKPTKGHTKWGWGMRWEI